MTPDTELLYVLCELDQKARRYRKEIERREEIRSWKDDQPGKSANLECADKAVWHAGLMLKGALKESGDLIATAVRPTANVPATAGGRMD